MATREIVFHGHFYQPPREDPWSGEVEREKSAAPYHDWNERIDAECYRPNAFARVYHDHRVDGVVNVYELISFNVGPTLAAWLEHADPKVIARMVEGDWRSARRRGGHGNAIAQGFHHAILPLCDALDRATEMRWGIADFRRRFGRQPEAMWLPETAADTATLCDLIDHGLRFAILSPRQAAAVRAPGEEWRDVRGGAVEPGRAYKYLHRDGSGRSLALFFYDGAAAQTIAFGGGLRDSAGLLSALAGESGLRHVAVDGETAGHHHPWGERALAFALERAAPALGLAVTNYGEYLDRNPPEWEAEIDLGPYGEGSSWSCAHGVGRWIRDCGCRMTHEPTSQAWRGPLRAAFNLLRDRSRSFFSDAGAFLLRDPWAARDAYVDVVLDPSPSSRERFLAAHAWDDLLPRERAGVFRLLEMQRRALMMYASCGWFFDDIAGLEAVLVLRQAARLMDHWSELGGDPPREEFLEVLAEAHSNQAGRGNGADVYRQLVEPEVRIAVKVGEVGEAARNRALAKDFLLALRRWADGGTGGGEAAAEERARAVLDALTEAARVGAALKLARAQELYWERVVQQRATLPLAAEIGLALGFAPGVATPGVAAPGEDSLAASRREEER